MDQMAKFLDVITKQRYEEDFIDRLNYRVTGYLLLASSLTLSASVWFGKPLQCWTPKQFPGGWDQYIHDYCYVENTYWLPFEDRIPDAVVDRNSSMLNYYQWVTFVLALQALMFQLPHILWRSLNWMSGVHVRAVIAMAAKPVGLPGAKKMTTTVEMVANHIRHGMAMTETSRVGNPLAWIFRFGTISHGTYVVVLYLFIKLLFVANIILQFVILYAFLGPTYKYWGADILLDLFRGITWFKSGHFPRVTLCDFDVRVLGNIQHWTVQCVLNINMLNEKIYIFLWFWLVMLLVVTVLSFAYWLVYSTLPSLRFKFVEEHLNSQGLPEADKASRLRDFAENHLRPDGVFVLRLMAKNAGNLFAALVVAKMWENYNRDRDEKDGGGWRHRDIAPPLPEKTPLLDPKPTEL